MKPYIGITGFMTSDEVRAVLEVMPANPARLLMVGVLASSKTLRGGPHQFPNRYPTKERLGSVFVDDPRTVNLIHFATDDRATLHLQLDELRQLAGPHHQGYQLNVRWPDPDLMRRTEECRRRVVLQIGGRALHEIGDDPNQLIWALLRYMDQLAVHEDVITDILIDPSGGRGVPFDPEVVRPFLAEIAAFLPHCGLGVAGGLSPETLDLVRPLLGEFPNLSIDAEGRLRTVPGDALDVGRAREYLTRALELFA